MKIKAFISSFSFFDCINHSQSLPRPPLACYRTYLVAMPSSLPLLLLVPMPSSLILVSIVAMPSSLLLLITMPSSLLCVLLRHSLQLSQRLRSNIHQTNRKHFQKGIPAYLQDRGACH